MKLFRHLLLLTLSACTAVLHAQDTYLDVIRSMPRDATLPQVSERVNSFFNQFPDEASKNSNGYKHWKRWEWFAQSHRDPDGKVGNWSSYTQAALQQVSTQAPNGAWTSSGPASISNNVGYLGRVECIGFHPTDPSTLYVGSATGGVWKTTNMGTSWLPMSDHLPSLSIGGIAVHPSNGNIVYALTGDGDGGPQWGYYVKERGSGVFKSVDGGVTWQPTGLSFDRSTENVTGYKLIINPANGNNLLAATSAGIYRTTDGGVNWTLERTGQFQDIEFRPGNANNVVAVEWDVDDIYTSTNNGQDWTARDIPGITDISRAELAVSAANSNNVYVLCGPQTSGGFRGLFRYQWDDNTITLISNTPNVFGGATDGSGSGGFPWWAIAMAVSPTNTNNMVIGGVIGRRSTNGGTTIFADHEILHADAHMYQYSPVDGSLYAMNDGGIFRSTNNGDTWTNLTAGLRITQFYRISTTPQNVDMVLGGTQDNGHYVRTSNTSQYKHSLTCCDGMDNAIDPTNSQIIYMCSQDGGLVRSTDGGDTWNGIKPEESSWVAPIALHTSTPTTIFFAGNTGIWRSTNSGLSGWVKMSVDGRGAIAQGTSNTSRFYAAAFESTTLRRSDNVNDATPTWTAISGTTGWPTSTAESYITGIAVNPANSTEVWVTFSGYNNGTKVYRSTNSGSSWTNFSGDLPNLPVHTIKFAGSGLNGAYEVYIGTDIGVYYRSNANADWVFFSNGLPRTMVTDIEITGNYIYAGTYGRGIWRSSLYTPCLDSYTFFANLKGQWLYQAASTITAPIEIYGGEGTNVHFRAGSSITLTDGFEVKSGNIFRASIGPCNATLPFTPIAIEETNTSTKQKE